ncbi:MAG: murein biosynthesis integral membrane protein MurJ [Bdellovibrio sp.]|nr:murein biosynthesis integral membrane protein MurJ [Bdellovibrio sp.]
MSHEASGLKEDRKKIVKRAVFMAGGTLTSRVLGLFRDIALAALFDRTVTDAWTAAFRIPNLFRRLFGEGSLSVSFIPVFIEAQNQDPTGHRSRNLINAVYTLLLIFLSCVTVVGIWQAEPMMRALLADNYGLVAGKWELTLRMARIMFSFVFFVCSYAYFMGILNALGSFALPALAPALLNISMLVFTFMPPAWFPQNGDGLAWGVFVGGFLQALVLWWALKLRGYLPRVQKQLWNPDVKHVLVNLLPGLLGLGLLQFATLVNLHFASGLPEGSLSYIYWADRLLELPLSLVSVSLGTALLPTLSDLAQRKLHDQFTSVVKEHFILNMFLGWPAALGLFFLAEPIVEVLFKRGHFSETDVAMTAQILKVYSVSLLLVSAVRVLVPAFYAIKNTWIPAATSFFSLVLHVLWAPWWISQKGLEGLVISSLCASVVQLVAVVICLEIYKISFSWISAGRELVKILVAGVALAALTQVYLILPGQGYIALAVTILLAALGYLLCAKLFRIEQADFLLQYLQRKAQRK